MTSDAGAAKPLIDFQALAAHRAYLMKVERMELRDEHLEPCIHLAVRDACRNVSRQLASVRLALQKWRDAD